jgi:glyoxylase-like metal-dependent hydrolase (beta-lactamase superfamily II)
MTTARPAPVLGLGLGALLLLGWSTAPAEPQERGLTVHEVVPGLVYLEGPGGNVGVSVGADGLLMIDDKFAQDAGAIQAELVKLSGARLRYLLNTHHHGDHTGGNATFGKAATIVAHENVRQRLSRAGRDGSAPPAEALPVITYSDGLALHFNGLRIRVRHFPAAHTDGDSVVYFEGAGAVHLGDLFFAGRFPFVDLDSGGSVAGLIEAVGTLIAELPDDVKIIPGHGPLATRADLEAYHAMLTDCLGRVTSALEEGATVEDLKRDELLGDYGSWSWGFVDANRFLDILAREVSGR